MASRTSKMIRWYFNFTLIFNFNFTLIFNYSFNKEKVNTYLCPFFMWQNILIILILKYMYIWYVWPDFCSKIILDPVSRIWIPKLNVKRGIEVGEPNSGTTMWNRSTRWRWAGWPTCLSSANSVTISCYRRCTVVMSMFVLSKWQRVALPTRWRASMRALFCCYLTFLDHRTNISASGAPNKFQNCHLDKTNITTPL